MGQPGRSLELGKGGVEWGEVQCWSKGEGEGEMGQEG